MSRHPTVREKIVDERRCPDFRRSIVVVVVVVVAVVVVGIIGVVVCDATELSSLESFVH